ncbi:group 3 secretory phospholipase A2 isoform X2 [Brienomyrus brachyistius]|uniref:group 3 secretory phospholipase A2 isoform X2 n=1 Tax=Brienomyrus brachyistius TaxID=42636 RepID=UPI0020B37F5A|nr:group 3 secretory phospholipase A2 isoform X2 [Brienomyrus brachyistius]
MREGNHVRVFFFLALASFSLADNVQLWSEGVLHGAGFCYWTRASASGHIYLSFLQTPLSLRLFHTTWTEDLRLVGCAVTDQPKVTQDYLSLCLGEPTGGFSHVPDLRLNVSSVFAPDSPCVTQHEADLRASGRERRDLFDDASLRRQKRSWIFPGTLWCGMGNKANNYEDLGVFERTDRCCREHDQCQHTISSFTTGYGLFNSNFYTISHCECDRRFHQCLLEVNNTISNMVGYTFFSALKVPCFVLKQRVQCVQMNWWGMCNTTLVTLAMLRNATKYNSTHPVLETESHLPAEIPGNQSTPEVPETMTTLPSVTGPVGFGAPSSGHLPRSHMPCRAQLHQPERGTELQPKPCTESASISMMPRTSLTPTGAPHPTNWDWSNDLENTLLAVPTVAPSMNPSSQLLPVLGTQQRDKQLCLCYKHLDECVYKIPPGVERFGLWNPGPRTMYHCSCTRSLARTLRQKQEPNAVQSLLLTFISLSCFRMQHAKDCSTGARCSAYFSEAPPIMRALRRKGQSMAQRFLEVPSTKVKRPVKRHTPVRLYQRCLTLVRSKPPSVGSWGPV